MKKTRKKRDRLRPAEKANIECMKRYAQQMADDSAWVNTILTHYPLADLVPLLKDYLKNKGYKFPMDNLLIMFDSIGEATLSVIDDESFDILAEIYENQTEGHNGYDEMLEKFHHQFNELDKVKKFRQKYLQWNSDDTFEESITFKRILQLM